VFAAFARVQLRVDLRSFLFGQARDRILAVSRLLALQLPETLPRDWSVLLAQYSANYPANFYLFTADGHELAGASIDLPQDVMQAILNDPHVPRREFRPSSSPHEPPPAIYVTRSPHPAHYWAVVHIPLWTTPGAGPIHGNLVWRFESLWSQPFFFDYRPWLAVIFAVIAACLVCWLPLIRELTRAISELTRATGQIAEGHFEIELPVNRRDELGRLSESITRMAHRLSGFVRGQRRFLGDIAHELCSPLARIQVALGILEQRSRPEQLQYVSDVREEVEHMSTLVNELLSFSKAQIAGGGELVKVNVAGAVRHALEREAPDDVPVQADVAEELNVMARPDYLDRALANVIRNAVRYAGHAGPIVVSARNGQGEAAILVSDQGPGVPESELEEIFKPFYRPEFARQRETGGTGLGLAIVKSCIEACNGAVVCRNRQPSGFEVEIRLAVARA
jgi:two-component system sensor histidine kinase CpxA